MDGELIVDRDWMECAERADRGYIVGTSWVSSWHLVGIVGGEMVG